MFNLWIDFQKFFLHAYLFFNYRSLADRFGGDDGSTSSSSNLPQGGQGVYTQTSGILYPSGQVHYQTNTGKFRK